VWKVYQKGNTFRVGLREETLLNQRMQWYKVCEEEPEIVWETISREVAFAKANILNTPKNELKWELVER